MGPLTTPSKGTAASNLLAGIVGGLVVLALGAVLLATGVIDTGETKIVRQSTIASGEGSVREDGGRTVADIYKAEGGGVVQVRATGVSGDSIFGLPQRESASGSGFLVDKDGTILTNAHVVEGAGDVSVKLSEDGDSIPAEVKGRDTSTDLAVLKVDADKVKDLRVLPLGSSKRVEVGDPVVAIGNPFGFQRTVTTGIVSAKQREIEAPNGFPIRNVIQTDASINPGNSGGPLLNARGEVIGINSQIATGGGQGSVGIGFAVPIDQVKEELPTLRAGKEVKRAYLGVVMSDVTDQVAKALDLPVEEGALVQTVTNGSPADKAGLHAGSTSGRGADVIVSIDGKAVSGADDVVQAVSEKQPGDSVELEYYRGKDKRTVTVKLGERPEEVASTGSQPSPDDNGGLPFQLP